MTDRLCLAATCHDPAGGFAAGVDSARALWDHVQAVVVNATEETDPRVFESLTTNVPGATLHRHPAGSIGIGTARRDALAMALETDCSHVVYSDLDHVLRWSQTDPAELRSAMSDTGEADLVVIGRSAAAFEGEPARLRLTEAAVNAAASLAAGLAGTADFMIAVRLMTRAAAEELVSSCDEDTIGSDVAWPLHLVSVGFQLGFRSVEGLTFRQRDDFGTDRDERDGDPVEWVRRIRIAAIHAEAMRPYLTPRPTSSGAGPVVVRQEPA